MKITKIDGISHKKYIKEGKLVKSTSEENKTDERLSELLTIRLDTYIKNPDNASEEENRIRRENLKKFFSNKVLHLKDSVLYLKNRKEKNAVQDKNYSEEDISEYDLKNKNSFSVLKKILLNEDINSEELEIFRKDVEAKLNKINSLKYSFEENKANYQKINENNIENEKIIERTVASEMKKSYMDYAMSVIISRALPDARDGLKPVHRRILYSMYEKGILPSKGYVKAAKVVGDVLGSYHPHGDSSIYDAMVRFAQDFSLRHTLIDGHGNFRIYRW